MIEVARAKSLLFDAVRPLDAEDVPLRSALGRVLAEPVVADRDFPPTDRSAMDGFAVRTADLPEAGRTLRVASVVRAGSAADGTRVGPGEAVRIFTGAPIPEGADAVVMVELTREDGAKGTVAIRERPDPGQNIRRRGEDLAVGGTVALAGAPIHAAEVAALAAVGRSEVRVVRAPRVAVLSTGDEVVPAETSPLPHQVRNSNAWGIRAQLAEIGIEAVDLGIVGDDRETLSAALRRGLAGDALIVTGGVSVGEFDLVAEALRAHGMAILFHGIAMRPGKPMLAGTCGTCLVLGLPGNPVSAFTGFAVLARPALRKMAGLRRWEGVEPRVLLGERISRRPGLTSYHLARVSIEDGRLVGRPVATRGSGDVLALARANAFLVTEGSPHALDPGSEAPAVLWRDFDLRGSGA